MKHRMEFRPFTRRFLGIVGTAFVLLGTTALFAFVQILRTQTPIEDPLGYVVLAMFGAGRTYFAYPGFCCWRLVRDMAYKLVRDENSFSLLLLDGSTQPPEKVRRTGVHPLPGGELWYFRVDSRWVVLDCRLAKPEATEIAHDNPSAISSLQIVPRNRAND